MILTDRAKEDFGNWYWNEWFEDKERDCYESKEDALYYLNQTDIVFMNAILIEWLDSLRTLSKKRGVYKFKQLYLSSLKEMENHHSISEIQKRAIIKANEIYNNIKRSEVAK